MSSPGPAMTVSDSRCSRLLLLCGLLSVTGCAGVDVDRVDRWDSRTSGFRYYMPEPYLLVKKATPPTKRLDIGSGADPTSGVAVGKNNNIVLGLAVGLDLKQKFAVVLDDNLFVDFGKADVRSFTTYADLDAERNLLSVSLRGNTVPTETTQVGFQVRQGNDSWAGVLPLGRSPIKQMIAVGAPVPKAAEGTVIAGGYEFSVLYLPNPQRIQAVELTTGIGGTASLDLKLKDGWLLQQATTSADSQTDETITATAGLLEAAGGLLPGLAGLSTATGAEKAAREGEAAPLDLMGLYRPIYDNGGAIVGFKRIGLVP